MAEDKSNMLKKHRHLVAAHHLKKAAEEYYEVLNTVVDMNADVHRAHGLVLEMMAEFKKSAEALFI